MEEIIEVMIPKTTAAGRKSTRNDTKRDLQTDHVPETFGLDSNVTAVTLFLRMNTVLLEVALGNSHDYFFIATGSGMQWLAGFSYRET